MLPEPSELALALVSAETRRGVRELLGIYSIVVQVTWAANGKQRPLAAAAATASVVLACAAAEAAWAETWQRALQVEMHEPRAAEVAAPVAARSDAAAAAVAGMRRCWMAAVVVVVVVEPGVCQCLQQQLFCTMIACSGRLPAPIFL